MSAFYLQLVCKTTCGGVPDYNIFWYYSESPTVSTPYNAAVDLFDVWEANVLPAHKAILPNLVLYEEAEVTVFNADWLQLTVPAAQFALTGTGALNVTLPGRRLCALFRAQLQMPAFVTRSDGHSVSVGRLMVGPMWDAAVDNQDMMVPSAFTAGTLATFTSEASSILGGGSGDGYQPIRVSGFETDPAGHIVGTDRSAAFVTGWTLRAKSSTQNQRAG